MVPKRPRAFMLPQDSNLTLGDLLKFGRQITRIFGPATSGREADVPLLVLAALRDDQPGKNAQRLAELRAVFEGIDPTNCIHRCGLLFLYHTRANWHRKDSSRSALFAELSAAHPAFLTADPDYLPPRAANDPRKSKAIKSQAIKEQGRYLDRLDRLEARHDVRHERARSASEEDAHRAHCKLKLALELASHLTALDCDKQHLSRTKLCATILDALSSRLIEIHDQYFSLLKSGRFELGSFELMLNVWCAAMHTPFAEVKATCFPDKGPSFGSLGEARLRTLAGGEVELLRNGHNRALTRYIFGGIPDSARTAFAEQAQHGVKLLKVAPGVLEDCTRLLPEEVKTPDLVFVVGQACYQTVHIDPEKRIGRGWLYTDAKALGSFDEFFKAIDASAPIPLFP